FHCSIVILLLCIYLLPAGTRHFLLKSFYPLQLLLKLWIFKIENIMLDDSLKKFIDNARKHIIAREFQSTLDKLQYYLSGSSAELINELSLYIVRFNRLREEERKGLISRDDAQTEEIRLVDSLLQFLDKIANIATYKPDQLVSPLGLL